MTFPPLPGFTLLKVIRPFPHLNSLKPLGWIFNGFSKSDEENPPTVSGGPHWIDVIPTLGTLLKDDLFNELKIGL